MKWLKDLRFFSLFFILLIALGLRLNNINWDSNYHLHPDERFLTMVSTAMKLPSSFGEYLDQKRSLMNPANVGYPFFVYGAFPVIFNKVLAIGLKTDDYNSITLQGRGLSAAFDILTLVFIYKITSILCRRGFFETKIRHSLPLWAAFFYAIAVLPIQLSHFFTVDTFLSAFVMGSFYMALRYYDSYSSESNLRQFSDSVVAVLPARVRLSSRSTLWGPLRSAICSVVFKNLHFIIFSAVFFALALASKLSGVFILSINLTFIAGGVLAHVLRTRVSSLKSVFKRSILARLAFDLGMVVMVYGVVSYIVLRFADPYLFETKSFLNPQISQVFINNIKSLKSFDGPDVWFPPAVQWMNKTPILFSLQNVAIFGVGIPYFIFLVVGMFVFLKSKQRSWQWLIKVIIVLSVVTYFLYQSVQFIKVMRYFIFLYPFFALFASVGFTYIMTLLSDKKEISRVIPFVVKMVALFLIVLWPLGFSSIYLRKHSRVEASEWIYRNLRNDALILTEHWDDGLPLPSIDNYGKKFRSEQLPVFDPDTDEKWKKIGSLLEQGDYYILSSNRAWGSIPTVSKRYPISTQFYKDLFAGKLSYRKIEEFTSYPGFTILGRRFELPDDWADESFTVYDHPKVMVFERTR